MEYLRYYDEIVSRRQSCRDFADTDVDTAALTEITEYNELVPRLLPDVATELHILEGSVAEAVGKSVGYNGFTVQAPRYLALFSEEAPHYLENAGFIAQGLTLKLTQLGLDACWLTINDAEAAAQGIGVETDKKLAVFIAFGHGNKAVKDVRLDIKSPSNVKMVTRENKAAPKISMNDLLFSKVYGEPVNMELLYTELEDALLSIAVAQSFFNRQPYRVIVDDDIVSLIGLKDELITAEDALLNYGIAMFNFYAVLDSTRANIRMWSFEDAGRDLKLPGNACYVAKIRI